MRTRSRLTDASTADVADEHAGRAHHEWMKHIRKQACRRYVQYAFDIFGAACLITAVILYIQNPAATSSLERQVASLSQQVAAHDVAPYPTDSVYAPAYKQAVSCLSFSDQASNNTVAALQSQCGWNGSGDANLERLIYDPDPGLTAALQSGGYSALPFDAQFLGQSNWLTYWVPVRLAGSRAVVAGMGSPLNLVPTFIMNGCQPDQSLTDMSSDAHVQAVVALVAGEPRYAMPGKTFTFNGNGLSGAAATDGALCAGSGNTRMVVAKITVNGPTPGAQLSTWLAFQTELISTGEQRINAVGLDTAGSPSG